MLPQTSTQEMVAPENESPGAFPQRTYTLDEAAGYLGVLSDDLIALMRDTDLVEDADCRFLRFTGDDIDLLKRLLRAIRQFSSESVYGGGDL